MPRDLVIREFQREDLPALRNLILNAENFGEPFLESEMLILRRDGIPDFGIVYVVTMKNKIVGYITLRKKVFALSIDSIIVDKKYQRKGIGETLIQKAKTYARSKGFKVLRADTANFMEYAIRFYLACGFKPCGYVEHDWGLNTKQVHFYMDLSEQEER